MALNATKIDAAAGPPDMRTAGIRWAAVGVTSPPGMFSDGTNGSDDAYDDEDQLTTVMAMSLLSMAIGKKAQLHGSLWKTLKRHGTGQVKGPATLFKFVKAVDKAESPAFEHQENGLQLFLYARRYDDKTMDNYAQHGFLPHLSQSSIRQLVFDHSDQPWCKGPAQPSHAGVPLGPTHPDPLARLDSKSAHPSDVLLPMRCERQGLLP
jgi:hypothetical protein